jgi:hypothetical protein
VVSGSLLGGRPAPTAHDAPVAGLVQGSPDLLLGARNTCSGTAWPPFMAGICVHVWVWVTTMCVGVRTRAASVHASRSMRRARPECSAQDSSSSNCTHARSTHVGVDLGNLLLHDLLLLAK